MNGPFEITYNDGSVMLRTYDFQLAESTLESAIHQYGWDNIWWNWSSPVGEDLEPECNGSDGYEIEADMWAEMGFDPYSGSYSYDC